MQTKKVNFVLIFLSVLLCYPATAEYDHRESVDIPVLMYHDILKNPNRQGLYTITPTALENDLRYLTDNGYQTVVAQQLIDYVERGAPLPDKPVVLTFDDGYYNNVYYAEPLLRQYNMRAIMFVTGAFSEQSTEENAINPNYSYVTWNELSAMQQRGVWDIQSHSWQMHCKTKGRNGVTRRKGESLDSYEALFTADLKRLGQRIFEQTGQHPIAFAYPFGCTDDDSERVLRQNGYGITFCSHQGMATFRKGDASSLSLVKRYLRSCHCTAQSLLQR